jgi:hypothetical protein
MHVQGIFSRGVIPGHTDPEIGLCVFDVNHTKWPYCPDFKIERYQIYSLLVPLPVHVVYLAPVMTHLPISSFCTNSRT